MIILPTSIQQEGPGIEMSELPEGLSIRMADPVRDLNYARNAVTLTFDLAKYERVRLGFEAMEFGDEPHAPPPGPFGNEANFDGVALSADGAAWHELQELRSLRSDRFTAFEIDLDAAIAGLGLAYNGAFRIRFCQYDDNPAPMDGLFIRGVRLTGEFPGLYVHLPMDDNADDAVVRDAAAGQRHQTLLDPSGNPRTQAHSAPGAVGAGLRFDGVDDQINLGAEFASEILGYAHDFTYAFWAQAPSSAPAATQYPLSKYYKAEVRFNPDGSTTIQIWPGANLWATMPDSMDGAFHHFALLRRGETIDLWYDGELKRTDTDASHLAALTDNPLKLGLRFNNTGPYAGVIDDFRMYDRALDAAELQALFGMGDIPA